MPIRFISLYQGAGSLPLKSAQHIGNSLTLRTGQIAHYNAIPARIVGLVENDLSACENTGDGGFAEGFGLPDSFGILIKSQFAAEFHIFGITVPLGIRLFAHAQKHNVGLFCFIGISDDLDLIVLGVSLKGFLYCCDAGDIFGACAVPVHCPAAADSYPPQDL